MGEIVLAYFFVGFLFAIWAIRTGEGEGWASVLFFLWGVMCIVGFAAIALQFALRAPGQAASFFTNPTTSKE